MQAAEIGEILSLDVKCECCKVPCSKQPVSFLFKQKQLLHLGTGFALYWRYLIMILLVELGFAIVYSVIAIIFNLKGSFFSRAPNVPQNWALRLSTLNSDIAGYETPFYIFMAMAILFMVIFPFLIRFALGVEQNFSDPSNPFHHLQPFSVLIKLQKAANYSEDEVVRKINEWYDVEQNVLCKEYKKSRKERNIVEKVYFHFNMPFYQSLTSQVASMEKRIKGQAPSALKVTEGPKKIEKGKFLDESSQSSLMNEQQIIKGLQEIQKLKQKLYKKQLLKTNKFIIVLKHMEQVQFMIKRLSNLPCQKRKSQLKFPGENYASVEQAPFPNEIIFDNQSQQLKKKVIRRIQSWAFNFVVIGVAFGLFIFLYYLMLKSGTHNLAGANILFAFILCLISEISARLSVLLVDRELQPNVGDANSSYIFHNIVTNILIKLFGIIGLSLFSMTDIDILTVLVESLTWVILFSFIFVLLFRVFNIEMLYWLYRKQFRNNLVNTGQQKQSQANKLFQKPDGNYELFYAQIIQLASLSFLSGAIAPISFIICFVGIFILILLQRFMFVNVFKEPITSGSYHFTRVCFLSWKYFILLVSVGEGALMILSSRYKDDMNNEMKVMTIVLFVISFLFLLIPWSFMRPRKDFNVSFSEVKQKIVYDYTDFNPVYQLNSDDRHKSVRHPIDQSELVISQLNMISRSLEETLRQALFKNNRNTCLQNLGHKQEAQQLYFQYENKVVMPERASKKTKFVVPPIFKQNKQDVRLRRKTQNLRRDKLMKLTDLVTLEEEQEGSQVKKHIKGVLMGMIDKV